MLQGFIGVYGGLHMFTRVYVGLQGFTEAQAFAGVYRRLHGYRGV